VATEFEIRAAEERLGRALPATYRSYLLASTALPGDQDLELLPAGEIDRFSTREPEWHDAWMEGVRSVGATDTSARLPDDPDDPATMPAEQLGDTIVISTTGDQRLLLLNPAQVGEDGEWEAWDFANWYPGAHRYPSFGKLVQALASRGW
jgi:hypothetical protein